MMDAAPGPPSLAEQEGDKKLRVAVRIRPFLPDEGTQESWYAGADGGVVPLRSLSIRVAKGGREETSHYAVDSCWGPQSSGQSVFAWEVAPLLRDTLCCGIHTTVFTHGASGSGKTHTMTGTRDDPGLIPLAVAELLQMRDAMEGACQLRLSFLEVYLDRCYDLLAPKGELALLEDAAGDACLPALAQIPLPSMAAFESAWVAGCSRRHSAATACNATSSRSHTMLTITITRTLQSSNGKTTTTGKLNLVDLAGFEDNRRTGNEGQRMLESSHINASLFALHKVLRGLTSGQRHVAFRDTKLTRLLRDSLGGTSRTLLMLCLSPGRAHLGEAHASLGLAGLAREVHTHPTAHVMHVPSPAPCLNRAAALQAWQQARGRTSTPGRRAREQTRPMARGSSPAPSASLPLDAVTRLAQVEHQLQHACQTARQWGSPREDAPAEDGNERTDKENVDAGDVPRVSCSPERMATDHALPHCPRTPLQQLRQTQHAARASLARECLAVLNHGDRHQLLCLRGIGPKRADAVMALRESAGGLPVFQTKEDLAKIGVHGKQVASIFNVDSLEELPSKPLQ